MHSLYNIITVNINDNTEIINNNYGRVLIFLLKIPMVRPNNFFEIYRQFRSAPSKSFASPRLGSDGQRTQCID